MQPPYSPAAQARLQRRLDDDAIPLHRRIEHAYATEAGTFWLELSDLTKRCQSPYTCRETPLVIREGRLRAGQPV
jgi:hypothetical protein